MTRFLSKIAVRLSRASLLRSLVAICVVGAGGLGGGALSGCGGEEVGRICDLGDVIAEPMVSVVASPSLDCTTRTCLKVPLTKALPPGSRYPDGNRGLCTAVCESSDDCERVPESPCQTGFTCAVATQTGDFCCRKVCVCKDYIVLPEGDGEADIPKACDPNNQQNTCKNLPGRS